MRGVSRRFGATVALDNVDLTVQAGDVHALVGENGAGKSTLMKILSGAIRSDSGSIELDGAPYLPRSPIEGRRAGIGMIYQELSLVPHLTVEENIVLGVEPTTGGLVNRREMRRIASTALARFDHPEIRPDVKAGDLTVGAQQLVEIARCLAAGCRVIVLDEPTSSLSAQDAERLFSLIRELKSQGQSVIYISHFIEEVKTIADRLTVLRDGAFVDTRRVADISVDDIVSMMVGRDVQDLFPRSSRSPGDVVLTLCGLAARSKPEFASLELRRGEVLGIAGLVGAGRTELLRAVFGLDPVVRGEIQCAAYAGPASPVRRWAQGAGMLSEDRKDEGLALNMSISDNTTLSRMRGFGPLGLVLPTRQDHAVKHWIDRLNIRCRGPRQKVITLSGGNQQKIALARLLQHDVDILLLDEPTRGIDVASKAQIYEMIDALASGDAAQDRQPRAILMVSSYLPELLGVCDRIAVMCRGRLGRAHAVSDITKHDLMMEATGQSAA